MPAGFGRVEDMTAQHGAQEGQTLGALVHQLSPQIPGLTRPEIRLAQAEVAENGKRAGVGIGMCSVAGLRRAHRG